MEKSQVLDFLLQMRSKLTVENIFLNAKFNSKDWFKEVFSELDDLMGTTLESNLGLHHLEDEYPNLSNKIEDLVYYNDCLHEIYHLFENRENPDFFTEDEISQYHESVQIYRESRSNAMSSLSYLISQFEA